MRSRALPAIGLGLASLVIAAITSLPAHAASPSGSLSQAPATTGAATCYSNVDNHDDYRTMSQNFAPILDAYDSTAADDVKLRKSCTVKSIQVIGAYTSEGAVDSETVTFYRDLNGHPGKVISSQTKVGNDTNGGSYDIKLKPVVLKKGTYWVSVVANLNPDNGGQWYWENSNTQNGGVALWENPRGGWQYGCIIWAPIERCLGAGPGPDLSFSLGK